LVALGLRVVLRVEAVRRRRWRRRVEVEEKAGKGIEEAAFGSVLYALQRSFD
jgi:hypothetical protein